MLRVTYMFNSPLYWMLKKINSSAGKQSIFKKWKMLGLRNFHIYNVYHYFRSQSYFGHVNYYKSRDLENMNYFLSINARVVALLHDVMPFSINRVS